MGRNEFLNHFTDKDDRILAAHILDKMEWTRNRNAASNTMFLNPHECAVAQQVIAWGGFPAHIMTGGVPQAERQVVLFLPDYLTPESIAPADLPFTAVRVGLRTEDRITHRDLLGSLMALGIRREVLGDILAGEGSCDIIVLKECFAFLLCNWESAGRAKLHPVEIELSQLTAPQQDGIEKRDTVATLRMDAVLGSGFSLSRSRASALIESGKVLKNGKECIKPDSLVQVGDILSVRGFGRLVLRETNGLSQKGRIRILMEKFG